MTLKYQQNVKKLQFWHVKDVYVLRVAAMSLEVSMLTG